ncbi:coiled-coil domain-containing protein, putative [Pediculus humanus corporis]|uniref:Coiled-coil domain-containing protein 43 n=1 Tax=Pediculus humanus subsp. corporis TaxID=121224 RepID=E0VVJ0_PEDHC|nr:coiled-coil domain-containing protein, putative [Pediculus humanus corporis]EEB17396.1 coiled-coil domain-containing protein, putative [Pediculus humanus corporis]
MAAGGDFSEFDTWLNNKLLACNTDEGVFGSYIKGILEGEESLDDKTQALTEILSEITNENITKLCQEILEKWSLFNTKDENVQGTILKVSEDMDVRLAKLMESQAKPTIVTRNNYTDEEKRIRDAILQQYGQMSDDENDKDEEEGENGSENSIVKNINVAAVKQAEKEKREKAKIDSQKKKEKDKEDREKQKQMAQEKKEKRKTQKGERRR